MQVRGDFLQSPHCTDKTAVVVIMKIGIMGQIQCIIYPSPPRPTKTSYFVEKIDNIDFFHYLHKWT